MTSAYSFSAPIAVMVPLDIVLPDAVPPPVAEEDDAHPVASTIAASGTAAERMPTRIRMIWGLPVRVDAPACDACG
jgi:hypothetical protein